jgi:protein ImuB
VLERRLGDERRAFAPVLEVLESFGTPVASCEPGWAAFATRGPARRCGGEAALVAALSALLADLDLPGRWWRVGIGDGAFVATQAAAVEAIVARGAGATFLAHLEIEALGRPELAEVLRNLGITTLGEFAALGRDEVLARFGVDGGRAHRLAGGHEEAPLTPRPRALDLAVTASLDPPAADLEAVAVVTSGLAERLAERLARSGLACARLRVEVCTVGGDRLACAWSSEGHLRPAVVAERLRERLESWSAIQGPTGRAGGASQPEDVGEVAQGGVERVTLVPEELAPDRGRQLELWGRSHGGDEPAARATARVQKLLGAAAVVRPVLVGGRGPGERVRLVPVGDPVPREAGSSARPLRPALPGSVAPEDPAPPWPGRLPAPSPSIVVGIPRAVRLLDAAGQPIGVDGRGAVSGIPAALGATGAPATVAVAAFCGPWPVDERWWEGAGRRRRARIQVVTADGEALLLVLERGIWHVEGVYD